MIGPRHQARTNSIGSWNLFSRGTFCYTPFGLAFSPAGDLFLVDIHVTCTGDPTEGGGGVGCGPADYAGQVLEVTFSNGIPSTPLAIAQGLNYPVSVTICDPSKRICPRR